MQEKRYEIVHEVMNGIWSNVKIPVNRVYGIMLDLQIILSRTERKNEQKRRIILPSLLIIHEKSFSVEMYNALCK